MFCSWRKQYKSAQEQSDKKSLGTVMQYSYFFCHSEYLIRQCCQHPFGNFLAIFPPPTLYKVKILDTRVQHCLWGEGRAWACVNWKTPRNASVPRLLPMIVVHLIFFYFELRVNHILTFSFSFSYYPP